ncbi:MAG: DUF1460 domain-containing protein [Clostridium sp.]|nr:DUF1460 domain-containing protein [Clostridium sp.]
MRLCKFVWLSMWLPTVSTVWAQSLIYQRYDSLQVENLLRDVRGNGGRAVRPIDFAFRLKGLPYVAATLETDGRERLVINLRQMDCTTLVENAVALALAARDSHPSFSVFCRWLERIRYMDGERDGYASRNHYFSEWIASNERLGIVGEVKGDSLMDYRPFVGVQQLNLYYMSKHPERYPLLKGNAESVACIRRNEERVNGQTVRYIPAYLLKESPKELACIKDGDILAIVTRKDGLDTSHLGLAIWKGSRLYMLHASSIHKKVVVEPVPLYEYMQKHPSQLGVRVIRLL